MLELQKDIIYGPILSRRLGKSLGINLLPTHIKLCSLNCSYCQYGWTQQQISEAGDLRRALPSVNEVVLAVLKALTHINEIDYITFSGNGEPTLHPDFAEIVDEIVQIRNEMRPRVKIALLSNSTTCHRLAIRKAIEKIDLPIMKLDAGTAKTFNKLNHGIPPVTYETVLQGLKALNKYVIQSMFVQGRVNNSTDSEIESWIKRLQELRPMYVQIYTLDRPPASESIEPVPLDRLQKIAERVKKYTGLDAFVYNNGKLKK